MTLSNLSQFVDLVENTLGWLPTVEPSWRARAIEVKRIRTHIAKLPANKQKIYSLRNLELAVELLRVRRQTVSSPIYVLYVVEEAVTRSNPDIVTTDIEKLVRTAIAIEANHPEDDNIAAAWHMKLTRAYPHVLPLVYEDWREARGWQLP